MPPDALCARIEALIVARNVPFHPVLLIDFELAVLYRRAETRVILARIGAFAVPFRVVDVLGA